MQTWPLKFNSILVVYYGNICRSPIGERLLRKRLPGVKVKSAGVHGLVKRPARCDSGRCCR
ncbi:hypothetical protein ACLB1E_26755 [Escherichia coli]